MTTFWDLSRVNVGLSAPITRSVASLTLLIFAGISLPTQGIAQTPPIAPSSSTATPLSANPPIPLSAPPSINVRQIPTESLAYTLGAGDRVRVDIFNVPEYSGEFQILVDGTINLPIIGSIPVQGFTLQQATRLISNQYARFLKRADLITVSLLSTRPLRIAIAGEVIRPGTYSLSPAGSAASQAGTQANQFPTVTQALQQAGGTTQSADVRQVLLRRRILNTEQLININLWELLQKGDLAQDITLRDGDSIFIPTTSVLSAADSRQLAAATFAGQTVQPLKIAIVGEIYRPGPYTVPGENNKPPTLTKAIQLSGGIKPLADIRQIQVRRATRGGGEQLIDVNLWQLLQTGDLTQDVVLQEGDTISVPTATNLTAAEESQIATASFSPDKIKVYVVGEAKSPSAIEVPPNTPLNQALLAAGGFNPTRANKGAVELIRLNPNGTVSKRNVPVDFAQGINDKTNPTMRNNDVIVVNRSGLTKVTDTLGNILSPFGAIFSLFNFFK